MAFADPLELKRPMRFSRFDCERKSTYTDMATTAAITTNTTSFNSPAHHPQSSISRQLFHSLNHRSLKQPTSSATYSTLQNLLASTKHVIIYSIKSQSFHKTHATRCANYGNSGYHSWSRPRSKKSATPKSTRPRLVPWATSSSSHSLPSLPITPHRPPRPSLPEVIRAFQARPRRLHPHLSYGTQLMLLASANDH